MTPDNGFARAQAAYDRQEPPDDSALAQWIDLYDTPANIAALAREMAATLADAHDVPERHRLTLVVVLERFLDERVPAEDRVRMMARTPSSGHHGAGIDTLVPLFEQFCDEDEGPTEPEDRPGYSL